MKLSRFPVVVFALVSSAFALPCAPAQAAQLPAWNISAAPMPSNFEPGGQGEVFVIATNIGSLHTTGQSEVVITLPDSLDPTSVDEISASTPGSADPTCTVAPPLVTCQTADPIDSGHTISMLVTMSVSADPGADSTIAASVIGGGAQERTTTANPVVTESALPFGFEAPLLAPLTEEDGTAATLAGSHPYQQTISFGFPTEAANATGITNAGHPRDIVVDLPPGLLGNPAASPLLCTEVEFQFGKCPDASQVGLLNLTTLAQKGIVVLASSPVYDMVPPPGAPAALATDVASLGVYSHLIASVRSDGDYGITVTTPDVIALGLAPIFNIQTQIWGAPTGEVHDAIRGKCQSAVGSCPAQRDETAFFSLPTRCDGATLHNAVRADSWEQPGEFKESTYESADLTGAPQSLSGCNRLAFEPEIEVQPTTNLIDSPSGLEVDLEQPQDTQLGESGEGRSTAQLKDATVTLPSGMAVNPSQADGLAACSSDQIGLTTPIGATPIHFSKSPQSCPDASKLGSLEVTTPLLPQRTEGGAKLATDPETGLPLLEPLRGAVYLAKPFDNPFDSLLAIYLVVEDARTGTVAKLAGEIEADRATGQITTHFEENPQLPLEHVRLHLFKGARASLITPPTCGTHTTTTDLVPWSTPEGLEARPQSSFQTTAAPAGGNCPSSEAAAQNSPALQAGTLAPQAGAFSPFVLKLSRGDGSQRIAGVDTLLPPGLSGKLAGIAECSEAQIAQAKAREHPNEGILEKQSHSCPASTEVGSVDIAAGAGPTPFHTQGHAYLAGPYKGAPLSLAVIVPAVAGPFDLGAVVSRVALHVDPETAQIHAVSDPLPQIIDGIPLDVRSIALTMGRPEFTLNPTSCDPMKITGQAISALGQGAALSNPFQVGGCSQLPFKPKLSLRLKGGTKRTGHPKLIANLTAKPGEANVAAAQVKLPPSAFLDQAHIRTVCTRVQFAANACPTGSIYGRALAQTPLLGYPLPGNVYLRSSNHKLPDLVVALKGPDYQPVEIDLDGKTDSVKGALRNTFEAVPDAPVSSFRLELFGGKRGLVINSRDLCAHPYKAEVNLTGQNGKTYDTEPVVGTDCKRAKHKRGHRPHRGGHR